MKKGIIIRALLLYLSLAINLRAQVFQNLDFESATVSNLPAGQNEPVSLADALPGWLAYFGTNQLSQVEHNGITLGNANIAIWGPNYGFGLQPLQGAYSAILQPGAFSGQASSASIAQTGLVPASAKSMQFLAALGFPGDLIVTLGGQSLPVVSLGSNLYGCDVTAFTGSVENLEFTIANNHGNDLNFLDAITFSTQAVPEPSSLLLAATGLLFVAGTIKRRRSCGISI